LEIRSTKAMKKLMMLVAMVALVAALAVPAIAQVSQGLGNESESGNVTPSFSVTSTGNNSNQCVTPLQFGNTGNLDNSQGFLQYASGSGNLEAEGPTFNFAPELTAPCDQAVQQSSAASSG
jgi:Tfp pilus assembly protein FimT